MSFTVSIDQDNIRPSMRVLSGVFPEMDSVAADTRLLFTRKDFEAAADPVTKDLQYGQPLLLDGETLRVVLSGDSATGDKPIVSITSSKPNDDASIALPTNRDGQGPYIVVSDNMAEKQPALFAYFQRYSEGQQAPVADRRVNAATSIENNFGDCRIR